MHAPGGYLHLVNVPSFAVVNGGYSGPTNELSLDSWSGHSSPHDTSDVNTLASSQRELHKDDRSQPKRSTMVMDDATRGMDLQSDVEALARPSSNVASAVVAIAPFAVTTAGLGAINNIEARVHDRENEGDDTSEGSKKKKKKEPMFLKGVELVNLDDYNVLDKRL